MTQIKAPWTDEQVAALNRWQRTGHVHPFTCANCSDQPLTALKSGWLCIVCGHTQDWAHDFMFEPIPPLSEILGTGDPE